VLSDGRIVEQMYTVSHKKPGITEIVISSKLVIAHH